MGVGGGRIGGVGDQGGRSGRVGEGVGRVGSGGGQKVGDAWGLGW